MFKSKKEKWENWDLLEIILKEYINQYNMSSTRELLNKVYGDLETNFENSIKDKQYQSVKIEELDKYKITENKILNIIDFIIANPILIKNILYKENERE